VNKAACGTVLLCYWMMERRARLASDANIVFLFHMQWRKKRMRRLKRKRRRQRAK